MKIEDTKPEYKSSPREWIPEEWEIRKIASLAKIEFGSTPKRGVKDYWDGNMPWCRATDITALNEKKYISETPTKITREGMKNALLKPVPEGSLLLCTRPVNGRAAINAEVMCSTRGIANLIPEAVEAEFLYYRLTFDKPRLEYLSKGGVIPGLCRTDIENFVIPLPPAHEQRKISAILSLWDKAITKVRKLIENLKKRDKGLAQHFENVARENGVKYL